MKSRDIVRLASVGLVIAALVPADASSVANPGSASRANPALSIAASAPTLASPYLTTATERALPRLAATVRPYNPPADAQRFVALINEARKAHGLAPLSSRKDLRLIAVRWSARMAASEKIWHNLNLRHETSGWWRLGENVGWAAGVGRISAPGVPCFSRASPEHPRSALHVCRRRRDRVRRRKDLRRRGFRSLLASLVEPNRVAGGARDGVLHGHRGLKRRATERGTSRGGALTCRSASLEWRLFVLSS